MRYTKVCRVCKKEKEDSEYHKKTNGKYGVDSICKKCSVKKTYAYRQDQMSKESKYTIARKSRLKIKFGLTLEDYDSMFQKQNGVCAICGKREKQNKLLAVDHCHKTGKVRGLLCSTCNTAIGKLNDEPQMLLKAANYLLAHGGHH